MSNPGDYYAEKASAEIRAREFIRICKADIAASNDPDDLRILGRRLAGLARDLDRALNTGD